MFRPRSIALLVPATALVLAPGLAAQGKNAAPTACRPQRYYELVSIPEASRTPGQRRELERVLRACGLEAAAAFARPTGAPAAAKPAARRTLPKRATLAPGALPAAPQAAAAKPAASAAIAGATPRQGALPKAAVGGPRARGPSLRTPVAGQSGATTLLPAFPPVRVALTRDRPLAARLPRYVPTLYHRPIPRPPRRGFWFTLGPGWGPAACRHCIGPANGGSATLGLGATVSPHLQLGIGMHAWGRTEADQARAATIATVDARVYPAAAARFFLLGGLGAGRTSPRLRDISPDPETGTAAVLGLGYDLRVAGKVSLTPFGNAVGVRGRNWGLAFAQLGVALTTY